MDVEEILCLSVYLTHLPAGHKHNRIRRAVNKWNLNWKGMEPAS